MPEPLDVRTLLRRRSRSGLWTPEDVVKVVTANGLALVLILAAWFQTSQADELSGRLTWLNLALVGLIVAGAGNGTWLLRGRQAIGLARVAVLPPASNGAKAIARPTERPGSAPPVAGSGMVHYHRPSCVFAVGRPVDAASRGEHERAGRIACGVCQP